MPTPYRKSASISASTIAFSRTYLMLFILPLPLIPVVIVALVRGNLMELLAAASSLVMFWTAGWLLKRAAVYDQQQKRRKWIRLSRIPWRFTAALLTAAGTFTSAWMLAGHGLFVAICYAALALLGMFLVFGFDYQHRSTNSTLYGTTVEELVAILNEAETNLGELENAARRIQNTELKVRLNRIIDKTRGILSLIEENPKTLRRARKFLKVYLHGAREITTKYATKTHLNEEQELAQNFREILETIEQVIEQQREKMLQHDVLDLDIQIEVLQGQLKREGIV